MAVNLSQGKVSEIMRGAAQVTALDVFERIADGLHMPDPARLALGLAPRSSGRTRIIEAASSRRAIPSRDGTPASQLRSVEGVVIGPRPTDDLWDVDFLTLAWIVGRLDARMDRRTMLLLAAGMTAETAASIADPWERLSRALRGPQMLGDDTIERLEARTIGFHRLEYVMPARAIYQGLTTHINELSTLLQSGPPERYRRRLAATAGEAASWRPGSPGTSNSPHSRPHSSASPLWPPRRADTASSRHAPTPTGPTPSPAQRPSSTSGTPSSSSQPTVTTQPAHGCSPAKPKNWPHSATPEPSNCCNAPRTPTPEPGPTGNAHGPASSTRDAWPPSSSPPTYGSATNSTSQKPAKPPLPLSAKTKTTSACPSSTPTSPKHSSNSAT
nr:hypothetical protein [Microbispora rosea]